MNKLTLIALCGVLLSTVACAPAHDARYPNDPDYMHSDAHDSKMMHKFNKMDNNGDGVITVGEHNLFAKTMFVEADVSRDGVITYNEFMNYHVAKKRGYTDNRAYNYDNRMYDNSAPARGAYRGGIVYDHTAPKGYIEPAAGTYYPNNYDGDLYYNERYDRWERR